MSDDRKRIIDDEEIAHLNNIRRARLDRLNVLQDQIATFGFANAPTHMIVEAEQLAKEIEVIDTAISAPVSKSISDDLRSAGRFSAYYGQWRMTQQMVEELGKRFDEFVGRDTEWRKEIKSWIIVIFIIMAIVAIVITGMLVYIVVR